MSRHTTYRGTTIDMDVLRRENENTPALGNMKTNARGDRLGNNGAIIKTADQLAREHHRVQTAVINSGLKGPEPVTPPSVLEDIVPAAVVKQEPKKSKNTKEVELDNGDIIIEDKKNGS